MEFKKREKLGPIWHDLKTDPEPFAASFYGWKPYEIRRFDRDFMMSDFIVLRETVHNGQLMNPPLVEGIPLKTPKPLEYTGRVLSFRITEVRTGYGIMEGWCALGLQSIPI